MKIFFLIDSLGSGGAQRQILNLAVEISKLGHNVYLGYYFDSNFYTRNNETYNITFIPFLRRNKIKRFFSIYKFINREEFDCVISFLDTPNLINIISTICNKKVRCIVGERSADPNLKKSMRGRLLDYLYVGADCIVSNSYANIDLIIKNNSFVKNKCHVIYNIYDDKYWGSHYLNNTTNDKIKILVAASHQYNKNFIGLLQAFNLLDDFSKKKFEISWFGDVRNDDSLDKVLSYINTYSLHEYFKIYPATNQIYLRMIESDIIGLFSFCEGLPNAICEGMLLGKMVIGPDISDIPLLVSNRECLFNPHSIESIRSVLMYVSRLTNDEIIHNGLENKSRALDLFNKDAILNKYISLLKD